MRLFVIYVCSISIVLCSNISTKSGSDLGVCIGSNAAAKLLSRYVKTELRQPRLLQMELQSSADPWFNTVAYVDSQNRIAFGQLKLSFQNNLITIEINNMTLNSASNIYILPLPFFLGKDTAHFTIQLSQGILKLRTFNDFNLQLDECKISISDVDIQLDNAYLLNQLLNPINRYLVPKSIIRDSVCEIIETLVKKLRRRFALEFPLSSLVSQKFVPYLIESNISLFLQLDSIIAENDQLTISTNIEWTNASTTNENLDSNFLDSSPIIGHNFFDSEELPAFNSSFLLSSSSLDPSFTKLNNNTSAIERLQIWIRDTVINELFNRFQWDFLWLEERIPVKSPKLPISTRSFLSTLCSDCFFLLLVSANGPPHVDSINSSIVLKKSDKIFVQVVNPTNKADAVVVNFTLTLSIQLTPIIEEGTFRTQVDLLDTDIRMQEGPFPNAWISALQDLTKGLIMDVIWPNLKDKIDSLIYSDGVQIPIYCGLEPTTAHLHFDDGRFGVSAALNLDDASLSHCVQQFKSKLPDVSKLLVIREKRRR